MHCWLIEFWATAMPVNVKNKELKSTRNFFINNPLIINFITLIGVTLILGLIKRTHEENSD